MGIRGLKAFLSQKDSTLSETIDIREEIQTWSNYNDNKRPIIVIDTKCVKYKLGDVDPIGWIIGGHYEKYNNRFKYFIEQFKNLEADIVLFAKVRFSKGNSEGLSSQENTSYQNFITFFDELEQTAEDYVKYVRSNYQQIHLDSTVEYNINKFARQYQCHFTYKCHNREIAEFVLQHRDNVLSIITNDTDFLAFEGNFEYWSLHELNMPNFEIKRFNRSLILDRFGINLQQLQLAGAICYSLKGHPKKCELFDEKLSNLYADRTRVEKLISFIKDQPRDFNLRQICNSAFDSDNSETIQRVKSLLQYYDLNYNFEFPHELQDNSFALLHLKEKSEFMYKLAMFPIYKLRVRSINFRSKYKRYAELIAEIMLKLCGILWKDEDDGIKTRSICTKKTHDEVYAVYEMPISFPPFSLPPLVDLVFGHEDDGFVENRWNLFAWVLDLSESIITRVRQLKSEHNFKVAIIALEFLLKEKLISTDEANAILLSEYKIRNSMVGIMIYPRTLNIPYIELAYLYVKLYVDVNQCLETCGLHQETDLIRFDGPCFHNIMDNLHDGNVEILQDKINLLWKFDSD